MALKKPSRKGSRQDAAGHNINKTKNEVKQYKVTNKIRKQLLESKCYSTTGKQTFSELERQHFSRYSQKNKLILSIPLLRLFVDQFT